MMKQKIALPILLLTASVFVLAHKPAAPKGSVYTSEFESVRAVVLDATPESFTITVDLPQNIVVDRNADLFAVYTSHDEPDFCADFREETLNYKRPAQFDREFDLSERQDVLDALDEYECVLVPNIAEQAEEPKQS